MRTSSNGAGLPTGVLGRELVLASAGSGKTYQLSSRMIGLLAVGVPPQEILASTFTRKAAGEILDRVLLRLARGATDPDAARELAESMPSGVPAERLSPGSCEDLLVMLVRQLHRVQVGTLDAFFQKVGRTFALDLDLPERWQIANAPDRERLQAAAVDAVLDGLDPDALLELVRMAGRGPAERGVHRLLLSGIGGLYETYRMLDPAVADPWGFDGGPDSLGSVDVSELDGMIAELEAAELPRTKRGSVHATWEKARDAAVVALRDRDWESFAGGGVAAKLLAGEDSYARQPIPEEMRTLHQPLFAMARAALGARYHRRMDALGRLLPEFDRRVRELRRREGVFDFADITAALARGRGLARTAELYYRLDGKIRHVLLDEFQDTSNQQWAVLEPLLDEILSGYEDERAVFIVADPKQSIYGWRGGEPRILDHIRRSYDMSTGTMARSWRSSDVVLEVVNRVFEDIEDNPVLAERRGDAVAWKEAFEPHRAQRDLPGYVRLATGPAEAGENARKKTWPRLLGHVAAEVARLHRSVPGASIGILTRTNQSATRLMADLRELGVEASEEGGVPVVDSAAVIAVLELLRLVDHPGDSVARYIVEQTAVGDLVGMRKGPSDGEEVAERVALEVRARLLTDGYGSVLAEWTRRLRGLVSARDRRRLRQLTELAYAWDARATLRPSEFVRVAESARAEDPGTAAIRVMTIHRAKGLEFDAVFLPELDGLAFTGERDSVCFPYRENATGPIRRVFPAVPKAVRALFPELEPAVEQVDEARTRDALSALYVGLTRARFGLYMYVAPDPEGRSSARTAARLVREAILGSGAAAEEVSLWDAGDPVWWTDPRAPTRLRAPRMAGGARRAVTVSLVLDPSPRRRMVPRRAPSALGGGRSFHFGLSPGPADPGGRVRGTVFHRWMEAIEWLETGLPDDDQLRALSRECAPTLEDPDSLIERFRTWLKHPEVKRILSRGSFPSGTKVEREMEVLARAGDHIIEGSIDRAVFVPSPEGARIEIFDWKTDVLEDESGAAIAARVEHHRPQLEAYAHAVAANERVPADRVRAGLVFLEPGSLQWL